MRDLAAWLDEAESLRQQEQVERDAFADAIRANLEAGEDAVPLPFGSTLVLAMRHTRTLKRLKAVVTAQAQRWGWEYIFGPNAETEIAQRLERHRQEREYPFLRAVLTWREAADDDHDAADAAADKARLWGLEPLPISPDEARELTNKLHREWCDSSALGNAPPTPLREEVEAVERALEALKWCASPNSLPLPPLPPPQAADPDGETARKRKEAGADEDAGIKGKADPDGETEREPKSVKPSWNKTERTLKYNGICCRRIKRTKTNIEPLLDCFESNEWCESVKFRFVNNEVTLRETIKSLNDGLEADSPIRFEVDNLKAKWCLK